MTKTLTEQWREGTLPAGEYYVKDSNWVEIDGYYPENSWESGFVNHSKYEIEEVLAPVPSYDEYKRLQKQLNKANEVIQKDFDNFDYIHSHIGSNQSNYNALMSATSYAISDIRKYLKKWGAK